MVAPMAPRFMRQHESNVRAFDDWMNGISE